MNTDLDALGLQLIGQIRNALTTDELAKVGPALDALYDGRVWFEREDWYDLVASQPGTSCGELLFRAENQDGSPLSPAPLFDVVQKKGLYRLLDPLLILKQVRQTLNDGKLPVSLNISSRNACDPDALLTLHDLLQNYFGDKVKPSDIVFELLEDDPANNPAHDALMTMRSLGYLFAIDDQSHIAADLIRAQNLAPYVDYIKIDGNTVNAARRGALDLRMFVTELKQLAPNAEFICEWIASPEEAQDLHNALPAIRFVQGRDLTLSEADFIVRIHASNPGTASRFLVGPPKPPEI